MNDDHRPEGNYEIQAWLCKGPNFHGYVYSQSIALDKFADGCDIEMVWLPRSHRPEFGNWREVKNITTWADGLGIWHASVPIRCIGSNLRSEALAAHRAILAELQARGNGSPITLHVTRERITNHGTVIYREK